MKKLICCLVFILVLSLSSMILAGISIDNTTWYGINDNKIYEMYLSECSFSPCAENSGNVFIGEVDGESNIFGVYSIQGSILYLNDSPIGIITDNRIDTIFGVMFIK